MQPKQRVLFLIWLMMAVAYLDRVNIAVAGPAISASLHLSPVAFGLVLSAFTFGYALMQIPGGWLADRMGPRPLLVTALVVWSFFTALTGAAWSLGSLLTIRVLFGLGEGLENGAQFKLIGDLFSVRERPAANAVFLTALALGPAFAAPAATWLLLHVGWRGLFACFALPGLLVAALLFWFLPKTTPSAVCEDTREETQKLGAALRRSASWLAFGAYLFFNVAFWGFLGWMPSYLQQSRHVTLAHLGWIASLPFGCGFLGLLGIGWLGSGAFFAKRAALVGVSSLLAAFFLFLTFTATGVSRCVGFLSLAAFFLYGGFGPFWAVAMDLVAAPLRGAFTGFVNLGGQIGGFCAPIVVGAIVGATRSFTGGFLLMIGALVLSAGCLFWLQAAEFNSRETGNIDPEIMV